MEMLTPGSVRALLTENSLRPKKSLGQHFLADPNSARRVATLAEVHPGDQVLEIGPGLGSLTLALLERGARVRALELDASLARILQSVLDAAVGPDSDMVDVRVGDACTVDLSELLAGSAEWSCVSNLPYNIAVPVVVRLLEEAPAVTRIVVMVQREVGERLAAKPGGKEYGAVSVKVAYYAEASLLGSVPPTVFMPRPKVESILVRLRRRAAPPVSVPSEPEFFALVRGGFAQRRKMLRSALRPLLGERATAVLECAGVAPTARAESLGLDEWAALAAVRSGRGMRLARVRATAYPKLTLSLRVLGKRADGFHDLDALVVSLGQPHDVIEAYAVPAPGGVRVEVVGDDAAIDVPEDHTNLAFIAAEKLLVRAGRSGHGVRLVLRKQIPTGAGLGGGSADAAAALLAVRRLVDVDIDDDGVFEIAAEIGSDVSFCLRGGAAWMRGRGEVIDEVSLAHGLPFLVAIPPFRLSTPDVYRAWDDMGGPRATRTVPAPRRVDQILPELSNDLEPAAELVEPRLVEFRKSLESTTGSDALLAGSGSAYVVPVPDARALPGLVDEVRRRLRVPVVGTTSVSRGVRLG